jgi:hypothetical protein
MVLLQTFNRQQPANAKAPNVKKRAACSCTVIFKKTLAAKDVPTQPMQQLNVQIYPSNSPVPRQNRTVWLKTCAKS